MRRELSPGEHVDMREQLRGKGVSFGMLLAARSSLRDRYRAHSAFRAFV